MIINVALMFGWFIELHLYCIGQRFAIMFNL